MIICLGTTPAKQRTLTFSSFAIDAVNRATSVRESASGKVTNVARVLTTLGAPATATGFLGGEAGAFLQRDMDAAGMKHDFIVTSAETRTCTTLVDESNGTATELVEEAKPVERRDWDELLEKVDCLLNNATMLVMSGTLAPGGPTDFYAKCVRRAAVKNVRAIVDASGEPLKLALPSRPFVVKPHRSELAKTLGVSIDSDASLRDAMMRMIDAGPTWCIVTMGGEGVVATDGTRFLRANVPKVNVINPIGSGDSFAAGLAASMSLDQDMTSAIKLATACGVANAMTPVAADVRLEDVKRLEKQVQVDDWN